MNAQPLLIAALAMLCAIGALFWARWTMQCAQSEYRVDTGLANAEFGIGTWSTSSRSSLP